jgi:hypothetical protein
MAFARYLLAPVVLLIAGASSGIAETAVTAANDTDDETLTVMNEGGAREGHTPTAFAGMGTGLFAGDNLNPTFPEGVGVQAYLTFVLPALQDVGSAHVVSDVLHISGTPFEDLGPLVAEPIAYETFGPELFDLEASGPHTECTVPDETSIRCDVTQAIRAAVDDERAEAQFRIRFAEPADDDGRQDLALFFRTDSNTNEAGLFELVITREPRATTLPSGSPPG